VLLLQAGVGVLLGFVLPGYLIARLTGCQRPVVPAVLASLVVLFLAVFTLGVLGVPLAYAPVAASLALVSAVLLFALRFSRAAAAPAASRQSPPPWLLACGTAMVALMALRAFLSPLGGADTYFRWNFLALQMREYGSFAFYPPVEPADFARYFYVDAIPPLVPVAYFWLYECFGSVDPRLTSAFVSVQYLLALVAIYRLTAALANEGAARLATLVLLSSPLFFWAFVQGQETGLTTLSVVVALLVLAEQPGPGGVVLAALCAAVGPLAREYGAALVAGSAFAAWRLGRPRREAAAFLAVGLLVASPWYVRNAAVTGNPFYSNPVLGLLPVNTVHVRFLTGVAETLGDAFRSQFTASAAAVARPLLENAPLQVLWGPVAALLVPRRFRGLAVLPALVTGLWLYAIPWTSGGVGSSLRILSPALGVLSCLAGIHAAGLPRGGAALRPWLLLMAAYGAVFAAWVPLKPSQAPLATALRFNLNRNADAIIDGLLPVLRRGEGRVLSDSPYAHARLVRHGFDVVPFWSPEFAFLFDAGVAPSEARARLWQRGVRFVLVTSEGTNRRTLDRLPLFRDAHPHWQALAEVSGHVLYPLRPPEAAPPSS